MFRITLDVYTATTNWNGLCGTVIKVVNEVQVMHKLESPHILKFHDWYETRNNLWLILEYCTGADLESLLKQDGHLPEASVRMFGFDMVAALKVRSFV